MGMVHFKGFCFACMISNDRGIELVRHMKQRKHHECEEKVLRSASFSLHHHVQYYKFHF